ncbi:MAG: hypothetical protein R3C03_19190 [Pirellulaceae bacterium]
MARSRERSETSIGEDSFLDVIANLVGVLIILVAVVSMQAGSLITSSAQPNQIAKIKSELEAARREYWDEERVALSVEDDCRGLQQTIDRQEIENAKLQSIRHELLVQNEIVAEQIQKRKEILEDKLQENFERQSKRRSAEAKISQLKTQLTATQNSKTENRKELVHYPTPIAKTVFSNEVHFQLAGNRLSFVPIDELLQEMKATWQDRVTPEEIESTMTGMVGPREGFRMQYQLNAERVADGEVRGVRVEFAGFEMLAEPNLASETIDEVVGTESNFQRRLQRMVPGKTTISIWVYPDSYHSYLRLRDWLRERGFQTASWPLQENGRISGGPSGFRTSAQ